MNIGIIGSGKVAFQLGLALHETKHKISFIAGRNLVEIKKLAKKVKSDYYNSIPEIKIKHLDCILIAVKDDAIAEVATQIPRDFPGIIAHTSGAIGLELLGESLAKKGIFYPLYSFQNKRKKKLNKIPFLITSSSKEVQNCLIDLAKSISDYQYVIDDNQRAKLHLAAVYANNFTNFMMTLCFEIMDKQSLDQEIILPIIRQSIDAWTSGKAKEKQTGPAMRGDNKTMQKHIDIISLPEQKAMYRIISQNISKFHS